MVHEAAEQGRRPKEWGTTERLQDSKPPSVLGMDRIGGNRLIRMHERHSIEKALKLEAERISVRYGNAPVVIVVGGSGEANIPRTMTASSFTRSNGRLRDLLGVLQSAIQIETLKHFKLFVPRRKS
jgi:hypothetical protein